MKHIPHTLWVFVLLCSTSVAQKSASATAQGTFGVTAYLTVTRLADMNFGDLIVGANISIDPTSPNAAQFLINGNANTAEDITFSYPKELLSGSNNISFHELTPLYNTISDVTTATQFKHTSGGSATTGGDGVLYVWAGGRISASKNQAAGNYSAVMTITVVQP